MGCLKVGHSHAWPTRGTLTIQRCEIRCNFCTGDAGLKDWKYAWFLRRHVRAIHVKKGLYKGLRVDCGWNDELPRDLQNIIKQETISNEGAFVPQNTQIVNNQLPLPDFIPQNINNFATGTYPHDLSNHYMTDQALLDFIKREEGNDASFPSLNDEDTYGEEILGQAPRAVAEFEAFLADAIAETEAELAEDEQTGNITVGSTQAPSAIDEPPFPIGRFYMPDVPADEEEDDRPLAEVVRVGVPMQQDPQHNHLITMISQLSASMQEQGVQVNDLAPTLDIIIRSLAQRPGQ